MQLWCDWETLLTTYRRQNKASATLQWLNVSVGQSQHHAKDAVKIQQLNSRLVLEITRSKARTWKQETWVALEIKLCMSCTMTSVNNNVSISPWSAMRLIEMTSSSAIDTPTFTVDTVTGVMRTKHSASSNVSDVGCLWATLTNIIISDGQPQLTNSSLTSLTMYSRSSKIAIGNGPSPELISYSPGQAAQISEAFNITAWKRPSLLSAQPFLMLSYVNITKSSKNNMGTKCWAFSFVKCSADVWNHLSDDAFKTQLNSSIHLIFIIFVRFFTLKTYKPMTQLLISNLQLHSWVFQLHSIVWQSTAWLWLFALYTGQPTGKISLHYHYSHLLIINRNKWIKQWLKWSVTIFYHDYMTSILLAAHSITWKRCSIFGSTHVLFHCIRRKTESHLLWSWRRYWVLANS